MTLMQRRKALMAAKKSILPPEYQQLEWLESSVEIPATASGAPDYVIGTGITPDFHTELTIVVATITADVGRNIIMSRNKIGEANDAFGIATFSSSTTYGFGFFGTWYSGIQRDTEFHEYVVSNAALTIDGITYGTPNKTSGATAIELCIFGDYLGNTARAQRVKFIEIAESGVTRRKMYPCYRRSDGQNGYFDIVDNAFHTCPNANLFTRGPEA